MENFKSILSRLPSVDHIKQIDLFDSNQNPVATIENRPGKSGSVAVYNQLFAEFGEICPNAAKSGLRLFAEHTADARQYPGKHPNIDRLMEVIENDLSIQGEIITIKAAGE